MCVCKNSGIPKWMVYNGNPIKIDDLGVPLFFGNTQIMFPRLPNTKRVWRYDWTPKNLPKKTSDLSRCLGDDGFCWLKLQKNGAIFSFKLSSDLKVLPKHVTPPEERSHQIFLVIVSVSLSIKTNNKITTLGFKHLFLFIPKTKMNCPG